MSLKICSVSLSWLMGRVGDPLDHGRPYSETDADAWATHVSTSVDTLREAMSRCMTDRDRGICWCRGRSCQPTSEQPCAPLATRLLTLSHALDARLMAARRLRKKRTFVR